VDNVISAQKKIFGLALSIILKLRLSQVLEKLDHILSVCSTIILGGNEDLAEEDESSSSNSMQSATKVQVHGKELRRRQMKLMDPINRISLEDSVRENLETCAGLHGESFNAAMSRMHPAALAQLKQALNLAVVSSSSSSCRCFGVPEFPIPFLLYHKWEFSRFG
ncbi:hypothetical protein M569_14426, partial [Genlisea aurea]